MSIKELDKIDYISVDQSTGRVVLTISDDLEFDEQNEHLLLLQKKLNAYVTCIEDNQVVEVYPEAEGRNYEIRVYFEHNPNSECILFLGQVSNFLKENNVYFGYEKI